MPDTVRVSRGSSGNGRTANSSMTPMMGCRGRRRKAGGFPGGLRYWYDVGERGRRRSCDDRVESALRRGHGGVGGAASGGAAGGGAGWLESAARLGAPGRGDRELGRF